MKRTVGTRISQNVLATLCVLLFLSCAETSVIGEDLIQSSEFDVSLTDTVAVKLSTLQYDSIITSNTGRLLVGSQQGTELGDIASEVYFLLSYDLSNEEVDESITYDSLTLSLWMDGYTLYLQDDEVVRLNLNLDTLASELTFRDDDALYNFSELPGITDAPHEPIASLETFWDKNRIREVEMRLPDDMGEELFDKMVNDDEILSDADEMYEFLKGFKLYFEEENTPFVGFHTDSIKMTIHATDNSTSPVDHKEYNLSIGAAPHFSKIIHSEIPENLEIEEEDEEVSSVLTNNQSYISGGLGYAAMVDINNAKNLLLDGSDFILARAELSLHWTELEHEDYPSTLSAILINESYVNVAEETVFLLDRVYDEDYHRDNYYTMDVTSIVEFLLDQPSNEKYYILIATEEYNNSMTSVALGDGSLDSELKLYTISNN